MGETFISQQEPLHSGWHALEGEESRELESPSDQETIQRSIREASDHLARNIGLNDAHTHVLREYWAADRYTADPALQGAFMVLRPWVEQKLRGEIRTDEEKLYDGPHAMLNAVMEIRFQDISSSGAYDIANTVEMLQMEFGDDITPQDIMLLEWEGISVLAEASTDMADREDAEPNTHLNYGTHAEAKEQSATSETAPADQELVDFVLEGNTVAEGVVTLTPAQIKRVLRTVAGDEKLLASQEAQNRYHRLNSVLADPEFGRSGASVPWIAIGTQSWEHQAECRNAHPDIFHPEQGGSIREAKQICSQCPVIQECLDYALEHDERFGVWGGLSERERRHMQRMQKDRKHQ